MTYPRGVRIRARLPSHGGRQTQNPTSNNFEFLPKKSRNGKSLHHQLFRGTGHQEGSGLSSNQPGGSWNISRAVEGCWKTEKTLQTVGKACREIDGE